MLTTESEPYLRPLLSTLTETRRQQAITIILPGGDRYSFNGEFVPIRAPREVVFTPRRGVDNPAPEVPSPMRTSPRTTPMPKGKMPRLGRVTLTGAGSIVAAFAAILDSIGQWQEDELLRGLALGSVEFLADTCELTLAQTQTQLQAVRAATTTATKDKTKKAVSERRIRIHGYSRRRE